MDGGGWGKATNSSKKAGKNKESSHYNRNLACSKI